jgi:hypothetical protein
MPRPSSGSFLQKHEYKNSTRYKRGKCYVKNIYRFVYVLHRINKRGESNKIQNACVKSMQACRIKDRK